MKWALKNNQRILANPFTRDALCPICLEEVIAKCGEIKIWHWAHKNNIDCDSWSEGETQWHLDWKNEFPPQNQEVIFEKPDNDNPSILKKHRADVFIKNKVIEFQSSSISPTQIKEREHFYGDMVWVINGMTIAKNIAITKRYGSNFLFRWRWFPKSWIAANKDIFVDTGDTFFVIKKINCNSNTYSGWGSYINKYNFVEAMKHGYRVN